MLEHAEPAAGARGRGGGATAGGTGRSNCSAESWASGDRVQLYERPDVGNEPADQLGSWAWVGVGCTPVS